MTEFLIKGGTVVTPEGLSVADVLIRDGIVAEIAPGLTSQSIIDASDCIVGPGFVDLHTHLRVPGREDAETLTTGTRAAALGGYTALVLMPNTEPPIDSPGVVRQVQEEAAGASCEVAIAGSITV